MRIAADANGVAVNNANVVRTDITTANGTIHVIDQVLVPPTDIVTVGEQAGNFTTLITALEDAGLRATLEGPGAFTVFAPTDDAFARLPADVLASLSTGTLAGILTYHVIGSAVDSKAAVALAGSAHPRAATLSPVAQNEISFAVAGDTLVLNGVVQVTATDIVASNGIIHVIDAVLLP